MNGSSAATDAARIARELRRCGLLLLQDKSLPNVVSLLTGEAVRGSWWGHRQSHRIFQSLSRLGDHHDVLFCKLIAKKVTLIHRRLWPAFLAAATSEEAWQRRALSPAARRLLRRVRAEGAVAASGTPVQELEVRLLVFAHEEHTESGAHRMVVETWSRWGESAGAPPAVALARGKALLEEAAAALGASRSALPWAADWL